MGTSDISGNLTDLDTRLIYGPEHKKCTLAELGNLAWSDQPETNVAQQGWAKADFVRFDGSDEEWNSIDNLV